MTVFGRKHCYRLCTEHLNEAVHWVCALQKVILSQAPVQTPTQLFMSDLEVRGLGWAMAHQHSFGAVGGGGKRSGGALRDGEALQRCGMKSSPSSAPPWRSAVSSRLDRCKLWVLPCEGKASCGLFQGTGGLLHPGARHPPTHPGEEKSLHA